MSRKAGSYSFWYCCPECGKKNKGKEIVRRELLACTKCGHEFTGAEIRAAIERVKEKLRERRNGADIPKSPTV